MSGGEETAGAAVQPAKIDPEALVLRGRPKPAVRFRRSVIVGGVAAVSAGLIALTWMALAPTTFRSVAADSAGRPDERATLDPLPGAPRDYRDVPVLGPPLPGDLGRPILEQQRELATSPVAPTGEATVPDPASERANAERQQRAAAEQAARNSPVVVQLAERAAVATPVGTAAPEPPATYSAGPRNVALGDWGRSEHNPHESQPPASPWMIAAGTIIPASLLTGLNSDLPGMVVAQVTSNVRDSPTGSQILIPQGARLVGKYDSGVSYGQKRAFLVWQRLLFPDGSSLRLDDMPATDSEGYAGLADKVDGHSWQLIKGVMLSSLLAVGSQLSIGSDRGVARALRESLQQNGSQAGEQIVSKGLNVQPTIRVRPGWPVRVLVSEDLILQPWKN